MTTPRHDFPELDTGTNASPEVMNEGFRYVEQGANMFAVKDKDLATPPGSPADGDAYIVAGSPTGAWTGHTGDLAFYMSTAWVFIDPVEGDYADVNDENALYRYDGAAWGIPTFAAGTVYATSGEVNTGTEASKAISPDAFAGSNFGKAVVTFLVTDPNGADITTGDGKAYYRIPSTLNGMNLVAVAAAITTTSSSGDPTVQIHNVTQAADMLTTKITIDAGELDSSTATPAVIDTGNDDVATADKLRIDIDVAGTGAKGLIVEMQFQLP